MSKLNLKSSEVEHILSPEFVRESAKKIFDLTQKNQTHFSYHPEKLNATVEYVMKAIYKNYPSLDIPFHSRFGHFKVGGIDRVKILNEKIKNFDAMERARIKLDLVITSVLLDAGAGPDWKYVEANSQKTFNRSEGLGVASFDMFMHGDFSSDKSLKAEGEVLSKLKETVLEKAFQVSAHNPLVGVSGRVHLLQSLGKTVCDNKFYFKNARPGNLIDHIKDNFGMSIRARDLLKIVLKALGPIWPSRLSADGVSLGDVWQYNGQLIGFHKLSQWMTYSLVEAIEEAGIKVSHADELTGLAEYRNGGLVLDMGLITVKDATLLKSAHKPDSNFIIEWRGLTVYLLDLIGNEVQKKLGKSASEFPLAKVLEGGTWWAGRFIAKERRVDGGPPVTLDSDGTVF